MRSLILASLALVACYDSPPPKTTVATAPIAPATAATPAPAAPAAVIPPLPGPPLACDGELAPNQVRIHGADFHNAARFLGNVFKTNLVVVGDAQLGAIDARFDGAPAAMRAIAAQAKTIGDKTLYCTGPGCGPVLQGATTAPTTREATLDFYRVSAPALMTVLADIAKTKQVPSVPEGELSLFVRNFDSSALLGLLPHAAPFPPRRALPRLGCPSHDDQTETPASLPCSATADVHAIGLGLSADDGKPAAMLVAGDPAASSAGVVVRPGSRVGKERALVERIACDGVHLKDGPVIAVLGATN